MFMGRADVLYQKQHININASGFHRILEILERVYTHYFVTFDWEAHKTHKSEMSLCGILTWFISRASDVTVKQTLHHHNYLLK